MILVGSRDANSGSKINHTLDNWGGGGSSPIKHPVSEGLEELADRSKFLFPKQREGGGGIVQAFSNNPAVIADADLFETLLRQIGDEENAEQAVTGITCQYSRQFVSYFEVLQIYP